MFKNKLKSEKENKVEVSKIDEKLNNITWPIRRNESNSPDFLSNTGSSLFNFSSVKFRNK